MHRVLVRQALNRLAVLDPPTGTQLRQVVRYEHPEPGSMIHVDVKKLGRIPVGGGWHAHGRGTAKALASKRTGLGTGRVGYTYLHTALDDHSRLAYTEALDDEKAVTASDWWLRAAGFFAEYGITRIARVLTDNGSCLPVAALGASPRMHWDRAQADPALHPAHERESGAVQRHPAREWAYIRDYDSAQARRTALVDFLNHYNHDRPHAGIGHQPPVTRVPLRTYRLTGCAMPAAPAVVHDPVQLVLGLEPVEPTS